MSSILDALKKLEEEKARANREHHDDLDAHSAADELTGRSPFRERLTLKFSPLTAGLVLGGFALLVVILSVSLSLILMGRTPEAGQQTASSVAAVTGTGSGPEELAGASSSTMPPEPAESAGVAATRVEQNQSADEESESPEESEPGSNVDTQAKVTKIAEVQSTEPDNVADSRPDDPKPDPPAERASSKPAASSSPESDSQSLEPDEPQEKRQRPAFTSPKPEPEPEPTPSEPVQSARAIPPSTSPVFARPLEPAENKTPVGNARAPLLTTSARVRHGLEYFKVDTCLPSNETRPYALAVINDLKYFLGDPISETPATLVAVKPDGIEIEIDGSGERYYVPVEDSAPRAERGAVSRTAFSTSRVANEGGQFRATRRDRASTMPLPAASASSNGRQERSVVPSSIKELPLLSPGARIQHGLQDFKLNMILPAREAGDRAMAIINKDRFTVGDRITNTKATLVAVEPHGIAIEIVGQDDRYYIPH